VDPWAVARQACVEVLERRRRERALPPRPLRGLSRNALKVLAYLHGAGGRMYALTLEEVVPGEVLYAGFEDLENAGLVKVSVAFDEHGNPAEPIVRLRYDVELPPSAE
jgi:hypothetical protein